MNNFESLKSTKDSTVTMSYESINSNVAMNVHYESTEKPPIKSSELLFNKSKVLIGEDI